MAPRRLPRNPSQSEAPYGFEASPCHHAALFYLHEEFLSRTLHDFFLATLRAGGAAVTLASSPHREAMVRLLERDGIDVASLRKAGLYTELDVGEVRSYCEVGHAIGSARLDQVVGEAVAAAAQTVRPPTAGS